MNAINGGPAKRVDSLSKAVGLITTLVATPVAYAHTKGWFLTHYNKAFGTTLAQWLTWATGGAEAWLIYEATSFSFAIVVTWVMTTIAMRRFKEM